MKKLNLSLLTFCKSPAKIHLSVLTVLIGGLFDLSRARCYFCKGEANREVSPLSVPICWSCTFKRSPSLRNNPWIKEPDRIERKPETIKHLAFDPLVIEISKKAGKVSRRSIQLEQCNPLESDHRNRFDLLMEHKVKPGFQPVTISGLDVELPNNFEIENLRSRLPAGYSAYLYYIAYGEKQRAIVCKRVSDDDFVIARNTSGNAPNRENRALRKKLKGWKSEYRCNLIGASYDTFIVKFKKIRNKEELSVLLNEIGRFCPDVKMSSDWRIELGDKLRSGREVSLWWD